jgi:hypothetical protein
VASWFETREDALLTMRVWRSHPELVDLILRSGAFAASRRMKPPLQNLHYANTPRFFAAFQLRQ